MKTLLLLLLPVLCQCQATGIEALRQDPTIDIHGTLSYEYQEALIIRLRPRGILTWENGYVIEGRTNQYFNEDKKPIAPQIVWDYKITDRVEYEGHHKYYKGMYRFKHR